METDFKKDYMLKDLCFEVIQTFLKKENALQELDNLPNYKRLYLRDLIEEAMKL